MTANNSKTIPFEKREVEEYERKRYRGIDQKLVHTREQKIIRKIFKKIDKNSKLVLDIPCGYGRFSDLLLDEGLSIVNSDLSFYMVKRAVERNKLLTGSSELGVVADAKYGLPFKRNTFNLLFSMRFFHHVHHSEERERIIKEFSRVTAKWVILSYYQMNFLHHLQRKFRRKVKKTKTRINMISGYVFQKDVNLGGLSVVKIFPLFRGLHSHHIALLKKS